MFLLRTILSLLFIKFISCQTEPVITQWIKSAGPGYKNFTSNIYQIEYSSTFVYVQTNSIPSFSIGPWPTNPNDATGKAYTFKIPMNPTYNTGTKIPTPLGHIGLWINGVSVYNADDGQTYNNKGVWKRNAYIWEGISFDSCKGHPDPSSEYHQHISSNCLYNTSSSAHSPLIGYAFDGYPIYGPYGYTDANNSASGIKRMLTSYQLRSISDRTTLPNGTVLTGDAIGPTLATYPLSYFIEDYIYQANSGDLDEFNGRYCKTPEYPNGVYAYFVSTNASLTPVYPFHVGPYFRGRAVRENMGTNSGKITVSENTTLYYKYGSSSNGAMDKLRLSFLLFINSFLFLSLYFY